MGKPARRRNWTGSSDEAAEYALKRWGHGHYLSTRDPYRGTTSDPTWADFADWIRKTDDPGSAETAAAIEGRPGRVRDFVLRVEPRSLRNMRWKTVGLYDGWLAPGDRVSAELAPGFRYELLDRGQWEVYLDWRGVRRHISTEPSLERAERAAAIDAENFLAFAHEVYDDGRQSNPTPSWDLQTVIVDKDAASSKTKASTVAREFGKRIYTSRETKDSWRFRQRPPGDFVKGSFRTRSIPSRGVSLVYGRLKRGAQKPAKRRSRR